MTSLPSAAPLTPHLAPRPAPGAAGTLHLGRTVRTGAVIVLLLAVLATRAAGGGLVPLLLLRQDIPVLLVLLGAYAALAARTPASRPVSIWVPQAITARVALLAAALFAVSIVGHYTVMWGYAFSRDEQMALFDAEVFRSGHFVARLPSQWVPFHAALNTMFTPPGMEGLGGISVYRPVNAAMHALAGALGSAALANPLLAAAGLVATWRVARHVLPGDVESQSVAVLLYACSTQVMANAMTPYAMTGHLALNMIWLALFLHDRWYSHLAALAVGILAVGLHQIIYHPLFAEPILFFVLVMQRRWSLSLLYAAVYAAAILLWSKYSWFAWHELGVAPGGRREHSQLEQLMWVLRGISPEYLWTSSANLVRFVAWEHVLLLPLLLVGAPAAIRSRDPRLAGMVAAIAVLVAAKTILRPYQGHGWGYRYMHGVIGLACILAAVGWRKLRDVEAIRPAHLGMATAISLLVVTPWLLWQTHAFVGPYARADRAIAATDADLVVIDDSVPGFTVDLVSNPPYVDRRPVRLAASKLTPQALAALCAGRSLAFADTRVLAPIAARFGPVPEPRQGAAAALRTAARAAGCDVRPLGSAE